MKLIRNNLFSREVSRNIPERAQSGYFGHAQNFLFIEISLKIVVLQRYKNTKEITINQKGTRMVDVEEDKHGLKTTNSKNWG